MERPQKKLHISLSKNLKKKLNLPLPAHVLKTHPGSKDDTLWIKFRRRQFFLFNKTKSHLLRCLLTIAGSKLLIIYASEDAEKQEKSSKTRRGYCFQLSRAESIRISKVKNSVDIMSKGEDVCLLEVQYEFGEVIVQLDGDRRISDWCPLLLTAFNSTILPPVAVKTAVIDPPVVNFVKQPQKQMDSTEAATVLASLSEAKNEVETATAILMDADQEPEISNASGSSSAEQGQDSHSEEEQQSNEVELEDVEDNQGEQFNKRTRRRQGKKSESPRRERRGGHGQTLLLDYGQRPDDVNSPNEDAAIDGARMERRRTGRESASKSPSHRNAHKTRRHHKQRKTAQYNLCTSNDDFGLAKSSFEEEEGSNASRLMLSSGSEAEGIGVPIASSSIANSSFDRARPLSNLSSSSGEEQEDSDDEPCAYSVTGSKSSQQPKHPMERWAQKMMSPVLTKRMTIRQQQLNQRLHQQQQRHHQELQNESEEDNDDWQIRRPKLASGKTRLLNALSSSVREESRTTNSESIVLVPYASANKGTSSPLQPIHAAPLSPPPLPFSMLTAKGAGPKAAGGKCRVRWMSPRKEFNQVPRPYQFGTSGSNLPALPQTFNTTSSYSWVIRRYGISEPMEAEEQSGHDRTPADDNEAMLNVRRLFEERISTFLASEQSVTSSGPSLAMAAGRTQGQVRLQQQQPQQHFALPPPPPPKQQQKSNINNKASPMGKSVQQIAKLFSNKFAAIQPRASGLGRVNAK